MGKKFAFHLFYSCKHEFLKKRIILQAYQDWSFNQFAMHAKEYSA